MMIKFKGLNYVIIWQTVINAWEIKCLIQIVQYYRLRLLISWHINNLSL